MTFDDFKQALVVMIKNLPTSNVKDRVEGLYEFFKDKDLKRVQEAAREAAANEPRFPTPNIFASYYANTKLGPVSVGAKCDYCPGNGWVVLDSEAYRSSCEHGSMLPRFIKQAPAPAVIEDPIILWSRDMMSNPAQWVRGFKFVAPLMKAGNPHLYAKVREILIETLGKDRATDLWNRATGKISNQTISQVSAKEKGRETQRESNGHRESSSSTMPTFDSPVNQKQGEAYV